MLTPMSKGIRLLGGGGEAAPLNLFYRRYEMSEEKKEAQRELVPGMLDGVPREVVAAMDDEVMVIDKRELPSVPSVTEIIEEAERRVKIYKKIRLVSLKATTESDWVNHHGQPYLMDDGTKAVAKVWGIDIFGIEVKKEWAEDESGRYYIYVAKGKAYSKSLKAYVEDVGICSQRDDFFGKADGKVKPLTMIDEGSVIKAAVTNLRQRLIKAIVGLKSVTWDELKAAGLNVEKIKAEEIKGKEGKQKQAVQLTEAESKMVESIKKMAKRIADYTGSGVDVVIFENSKFVGKDGKERGARKVEELTSGAWVRKTYGNMKQIYDEIFGGVV